MTTMCDCGARHTDFPQFHSSWCSTHRYVSLPPWIGNGWMDVATYRYLTANLSEAEFRRFNAWVGGDPCADVVTGPLYCAIMGAISMGYG